jgi:hypothetical protein
MNRVAIIFLLVVVIVVISQPISADESIWVHVSHRGNATWTLRNSIPTYHMLLIDDNGVNYEIAPYGCITLSGGPGKYYYSQWEIDQVTKNEPAPNDLSETICEDYVGT